MTAPRTSEAIRPVAGERFRSVAGVDFGGAKRKKAAALLAAFHDAGRTTVATAELAEWLKWDRRKVASLLKRLEADGYVDRSLKGRWRLEPVEEPKP